MKPKIAPPKVKTMAKTMLISEESFTALSHLTTISTIQLTNGITSKTILTNLDNFPKSL